MDIGIPLRDLGEIDSTALSETILGLGEQVWKENAYRQKKYDVHNLTESVVMIFTDGSGWPDIEVTKESGWDLMAETAMPLMEKIIEEFYPPGGTIVRAMAAKLIVGGVIKPHVDMHPSFHVGHRIHIPITTNSRVRFMIDGKPNRFVVGHAYEINNQKQHSVMNKGKEDRITFIFDYVPPEQLKKMQDGTAPGIKK
jgi:hypothetical protein